MYGTWKYAVSLDSETCEATTSIVDWTPLVLITSKIMCAVAGSNGVTIPIVWPGLAEGSCVIAGTPVAAFTLLAGRMVKSSMIGVVSTLPDRSTMMDGLICSSKVPAGNGLDSRIVSTWPNALVVKVTGTVVSSAVPMIPSGPAFTSVIPDAASLLMSSGLLNVIWIDFT